MRKSKRKAEEIEVEKVSLIKILILDLVNNRSLFRRF